MILLDSLRPPTLMDPSVGAYKDWLHLNVFDHAASSVGLINVSLHGAPDDKRSRAVGVALVCQPDVGWFGNLEIRGIEEAVIGRASIAMEHTALAVQANTGTVMASVQDPHSALAARVTATAAAPPINGDEKLSLGGGWISWYAVPRLTLVGDWTISGQHTNLKTASAYHDHNWGRWHWGDNLGWDWGCFLTPGSEGVGFVLSRTCDRAHRIFGKHNLVVQVAKKRRTFAGSAVTLDYSGTLEIARRIPGALAALHHDHAGIKLPNYLEINADDGMDRANVQFSAHSAVQLILADPQVRGYSFIHEMAGSFNCSGCIGGTEIYDSGLGILEMVC